MDHNPAVRNREINETPAYGDGAAETWVSLSAKMGARSPISTQVSERYELFFCKEDHRQNFPVVFDTFASTGRAVPLIVKMTSKMKTSDNLRSELYTTFLSGMDQTKSYGSSKFGKRMSSYE